METIYAESRGITPESEISKELMALFDSADTGELVFKKGTYYIDSDNCREIMLYITNTVGDDEFSPDETPHLNRVPFYLKGKHNLTIDGNNSVFIIRGKATSIALESCENISLKNLELRYEHPDIHELEVTEKGAFFVEFTTDRDTELCFENGKPYFSGNGYHYPVDRNRKTANWIPLITADRLDTVKRVPHPLKSAVGYSPTNCGFRTKFLNTSRFNIGDRFYIYDVRRQHVGIFINKCKNIYLENVRQRFNYSLGLVLQDSENVAVKNCVFAPEENSSRLLASCADFVQACMCRGKISVSDCRFVGAGDDCINVHGIHFRVIDIHDDTVCVRFMHPQTHGFDSFRIDDEIAFIDTKTLLEKGVVRVKSSKMTDEYNLELKVTGDICGKIGDAIENVSACPDLDFERNDISRIITRGVLVTTRGKVRIKENRFIDTFMSGILISDDAESWFESGRCEDIEIDNNSFISCGQPTILIKPENKLYAGAVHKNITVSNNKFANDGLCISAVSTDNIKIQNNSFKSKKPIKLINCNQE